MTKVLGPYERPWLHLEEVAAMLGVDTKELWRRRQDSAYLPHERVGVKDRPMVPWCCVNAPGQPHERVLHIPAVHGAEVRAA
jgi:hypothetical protein